MNTVYTVYEIGLPQNDSNGAVIAPTYLVKTPSFTCDACGCYGDRPHALWLSSMEAKKLAAKEILDNGNVSTVKSYDEFVKYCARLREVFGLDCELLPGTMIGSKPILVCDSGQIGGLNEAKIRDGIDFIFAGFHLVVSERVRDLLASNGLNIKFGRVEFVMKSGGAASVYYVLEMAPQLVWDESEREKYGISICNRCGAVQKKIHKGTFKMKQFRRDLFEGNKKIFRGLESPGYFVGQQLCDQLNGLDPRGVALRKVGEYSSSRGQS